MSSKPRKQLSIVSAAIVVWLALVLAGCGVKGDPVAPTQPPDIGRGQPTYRRASEKIRLKKVSPAEEEKENKEPEDE